MHVAFHFESPGDFKRRFLSDSIAISIVTPMDNQLPNDAAPLSQLPESHMESIRILESAYLRHRDPIKQSGFSGGADRWRTERFPLLDAVDGDGDFIDLGCANGHLLQSVLGWASERGIDLTPYGIDLNPRLLQETMKRFPDKPDHFWVANAWGWLPPKRFRWVYAIWDLVPIEYLPHLARHLLQHAVKRNGALILGAYGSKSEDWPSIAIADVLREGGVPVSGVSQGGELPRGGPVTRFAWVRRSDWQPVEQHLPSPCDCCEQVK